MNEEQKPPTKCPECGSTKLELWTIVRYTGKYSDMVMGAKGEFLDRTHDYKCPECGLLIPAYL